MDVSVGELVTAGTALFGIGATWATLSHRLKDQGRRIGAVSKEVAELKGEVKGFMTGVRIRRATKPQGQNLESTT